MNGKYGTSLLSAVWLTAFRDEYLRLTKALGMAILSAESFNLAASRVWYANRRMRRAAKSGQWVKHRWYMGDHGVCKRKQTTVQPS